MIRFVGLMLVAVAAEALALDLRDDRGVTISLGRPAERIVALAPHLAEMTFAAGGGAKLVGVSSFSRHPAEAERLPIVATAGRIDIERLVALRPDLVLGWKSGNSPLQLNQLEHIGIPVFVTEVRSFADIPRIVRAIGALADSVKLAEARARGFEMEVERLRERYASRRPVAVFLEIWHRPMLTVSGSHLISDALGLCGGRNVFAAAKTLTPLVSREQILEARPEAIVTAGFGADTFSTWKGFQSVPAVRDRRVFAIDPDALHAQGPHVLAGVRALCEGLDRARS
ncbi:MAG TPA: cobalamin-binding protein [Burkholderiales bacterium]|nr:cobalamin-binding protein [Burkholderiales bacterium]